MFAIYARFHAADNNLSRLVIDPYREACKIGWRLGERLDLDIPFFVARFDAASEELKVPIDRGVAAAGAAYLGATRPGPNAPWLQLCEPGRDAPSHDAAGVVYRVGERWHPMPTARARAEQILGLLLGSRRDEASMMARCAGKTRLHNIEPEDLRSVTRATAAATGIPLAGTRAA